MTGDMVDQKRLSGITPLFQPPVAFRFVVVLRIPDVNMLPFHRNQTIGSVELGGQVDSVGEPVRAAVRRQH